MAIGTGAAILGGAALSGVLGGSSAKSAANAQERAAAEANATQRYMYDQTRADQAGYRESGNAANNRLSYLLGIGGTAANRSTPSLASAPLTNGVNYNPDLYANNENYRRAWDSMASSHMQHFGKGYDATSDMAAVQAALRNAIQGDIDKERAEQLAAEQGGDPNYGSLLKKFDQNDLNNDVVYNSGLQFGLDQGTQGINRLAAASGSQLSGATLKALTRFGNDYGSTKANEAYNRYNTTNDSIYNKLAGVSGAGQQATNQVAASGQNYANNVSQNQIGLGNARGASAIAQGNALSGAFGQGINAYQQQNYLNSLGNSGFDNANGYSSEMARLMGQG